MRQNCRSGDLEFKQNGIQGHRELIKPLDLRKRAGKTKDRRERGEGQKTG